MELETLLADPALDLPIPPGALQAVDRRARALRRRRQALVATPLLALVAAAATQLPSGRSSQVLYGDSPSPSEAPTAPLRPVDGAAPAGTRARFIALAEAGTLAERAFPYVAQGCMHAKGERFDVTARTDERLSGSLERRYGLDPAVVASEGYGLNEPSPPAPADDNAFVRSLKGEELRRWTEAWEGPAHGPTTKGTVPMTGEVGHLVGGCLGQAYRDLWGSDENSAFATMLGNLGIPVFESFDDPERTALDARWSACMTTQGERGLSQPDAARERARSFRRTDPEHARARELALARLDLDCQSSTGYAQDRNALEDRYLAAYAVRYADLMDRAEQVASATRARAQAVLDAQP